MYSHSDRIALERAYKLQRRFHANQCSNTGTGTYSEVIFANYADYAAISSFASETSLLSGARQPTIPALTTILQGRVGMTFMLMAQGVLGTTGTPTYTFLIRLGTTAGPTQLGGAIIGTTAAITTLSAVTNKYWYLQLLFSVYVQGIGANNTTISGAGWMQSPTGFAAPQVYPLEPTTPDTATWTQTFDGSLTQFLNVSSVCSSSNPSNTLTLKNLVLLGLN